MSDKKEIRQTAHELMELHIEASFTHDQSLRLHTVNEPWPGSGPAPKFFMGRTIEGTTICRFRYDVPDTLVQQLELLCADEPIMSDFHRAPKHLEEYMRLLQGQKFTMGPCFLVPVENIPSTQVFNITSENITELLGDGFQWLISEIDYVQPCIALLRENQAVSICRSVRITSSAHEAGLETLDKFRNRGYAAEVVAGWAMAVRKMGCVPLYSTSWDNLSSQSVERKSALSFYGANFTIIGSDPWEGL